MKCLFCGKRLTLLQRLSGREFCCAGHAELYKRDQESMGLARLIEAKQQAKQDSPAAPFLQGKKRNKKEAARGGPPVVERFVEQRPQLQSIIQPRFEPGDPVPVSPQVILPQAESILGKLGFTFRGATVAVAWAAEIEPAVPAPGVTEAQFANALVSLGRLTTTAERSPGLSSQSFVVIAPGTPAGSLPPADIAPFPLDMPLPPRLPGFREPRASQLQAGQSVPVAVRGESGSAPWTEASPEAFPTPGDLSSPQEEPAGHAGRPGLFGRLREAVSGFVLPPPAPESDSRQPARSDAPASKLTVSPALPLAAKEQTAGTGLTSPGGVSLTNEAASGGAVEPAERLPAPASVRFGCTLLIPGDTPAPSRRRGLRPAGRVAPELGQPLGTLEAATALIEERTPEPVKVVPGSPDPVWPDSLAEIGALAVEELPVGGGDLIVPPAAELDPAPLPVPPALSESPVPDADLLAEPSSLATPRPASDPPNGMQEPSEPPPIAVNLRPEAFGCDAAMPDQPPGQPEQNGAGGPEWASLVVDLDTSAGPELDPTVVPEAAETEIVAPLASTDVDVPRSVERAWEPPCEAGWIALAPLVEPSDDFAPKLSAPMPAELAGSDRDQTVSRETLPCSPSQPAPELPIRHVIHPDWEAASSGSEGPVAEEVDQPRPVPFHTATDYPGSPVPAARRELEPTAALVPMDGPEEGAVTPASASGPLPPPLSPTAVAAPNALADLPTPTADLGEFVPPVVAKPAADAPAPLHDRLLQIGLDRAVPLDHLHRYTGELEPLASKLAVAIPTVARDIDTVGSLDPPKPPSPPPPWQRAWRGLAGGLPRVSPGVKWLLMCIPILAGLVWHTTNKGDSQVPDEVPVEVAVAAPEEFVPAMDTTPEKISVPASPDEVEASSDAADGELTLSARWRIVKENIMDRAAISLADDFRAGLGDWEGMGNWARSWSYDKAGFVRPGALAIYRPSLELVDYEFEFAGQIEQRGISWVVRAADADNYIAGRLVITQPGPMPEGALLNYSVVDGNRGRVRRTPLPFLLRNAKMYRVRVDVRGERLTTYVDDHLVDFYDEARLRSGGVGFFQSRGERSRLRWISLTHQYDILGRLCALIVPYQLDRHPRSLKR